MMMRNNRNILLAGLVVFTIIPLAAAFLAARSYNGVFWTAVIFDLIGASGVGYFSVFAYDRSRNSLRDVPQNSAVVYGVVFYWIVQLLFSIPAVFADWELRYVLPVHLLLFGVFFVGILLLLMGRNYITSIESKESATAQTVSDHRRRVAVLEQLSQKNPEDKLLRKTFEIARYSDPVSLPELCELEQQLDALIAELGSASADRRLSLLEALTDLLNERNSELRLRKQKGI